jgi:hypothetical protein
MPYMGEGGRGDYHSVCGAVSENDEVELSGEGRFEPTAEDDTLTISGINKTVQRWIKSDIEDEDKMKAVMTNGSDNWLDWYRLSKWAVAKSEVARIGVPIDEFDVLKGQEYHEGVFTECGISDMTYGEEPAEGEKKWVVFLDTHS